MNGYYTGYSNYDAADILVEASRRKLVQHLAGFISHLHEKVTQVKTVTFYGKCGRLLESEYKYLQNYLEDSRVGCITL